MTASIAEFAGPENDGPNLRAGKWNTMHVVCMHLCIPGLRFGPSFSRYLQAFPVAPHSPVASKIESVTVMAGQLLHDGDMRSIGSFMFGVLSIIYRSSGDGTAVECVSDVDLFIRGRRH